MLNKLSTELCQRYKRVKVGDTYKVLDLEQDPFLGQMPEAYRRELFTQCEAFDDFGQELYHELQLVSDYFAGEYTETGDKDFQDIWENFFYCWYWSDVWVCYSPEVLEMERKTWEGRTDINPHKCHGENPYRLFKLVKRKDQRTAVFASVWTGLNYEIDTDTIPMVWASCNDGLNWILWRKLLTEKIAGEQMFIQSQKLTAKRLFRKVRNPEQANLETDKLKTTAPIFEVDASESVLGNNYETFDICPPEIPKGIWENLLAYFMTKAGQLGYVQNMNDKRERLTTGENFKDLHGVTNIEYRNLKKLNAFGELFAKFYPGKLLNFNLSNWGEAQGLPKGQFGGEEIDNIKGNSGPENFDKSKE